MTTALRPPVSPVPPVPPSTTPLPAAPFGRTVIALALTALLATGQLYGLIPLVNAMAAEWHTTPATATWLVTVYGLGYAAGFVLFGPLSDRYGRRRVIVTGVAATAALTLLTAAAPGFGAALLLRIVQGMAMGAFPPVAMAYIGERIEPRRRLVSMTALTTGFLASAALAQLAAQALAGLGWRMFFVLTAVLFALAAVALRRVLLPDAPAPAGVSPLDAYRAMPRLLRSPDLRLLYLAVPTVLTGFVAVFTGLQLTGTEGLVALRASGLPVILALPFLTPLLARVPGPRRAALALAAAGLATVLIALLAPGTLGLALLLMVLTAGVGLAAPALVEAIGARAGAARGPASSLFTALLFVGASLGPQVAGALTGGGFAALAYVVTGLFAAGALVLALASRR
ncbi:MFS transporter [Actinomadura hibisca]|uniref:MFS transporter n=1 Tax=Actinomadura hibisca TaxID=68565 RepID=UPI000A031ED4|nr:MFS transporter [Actinomadura hibisca]